ncbi:MAG: hypothetical protein ACTSXQ_05190 [Alphaproteobacteria bacterium]
MDQKNLSTYEAGVLLDAIFLAGKEIKEQKKKKRKKKNKGATLFNAYERIGKTALNNNVFSVSEENGKLLVDNTHPKRLEVIGRYSIALGKALADPFVRKILLRAINEIGAEDLAIFYARKGLSKFISLDDWRYLVDALRNFGEDIKIFF